VFLGFGDEDAEDLLGGFRGRGERCDEAGQVGAGDVGEPVAQVGDVARRVGGTILPQVDHDDLEFSLRAAGGIAADGDQGVEEAGG
jgi:hypothetical protein